MSPTNGRGGYVHPMYLGIYDEDMYHYFTIYFLKKLCDGIRYNHARPTCDIPRNCTHDCSGTLLRTQDACQEFIESYTETARLECERHIAMARFFCVCYLVFCFWYTLLIVFI